MHMLSPKKKRLLFLLAAVLLLLPVIGLTVRYGYNPSEASELTGTIRDVFVDEETGRVRSVHVQPDGADAEILSSLPLRDNTLYFYSSGLPMLPSTAQSFLQAGGKIRAVASRTVMYDSFYDAEGNYFSEDLHEACYRITFPDAEP